MGKFDTISEDQKDKNQYRFQGYNLPMVQLDSTGPQYAVVLPHQYYDNQPLYYTKPVYPGHPGGFSQVHLQTKDKLYPFGQFDENV